MIFPCFHACTSVCKRCKLRRRQKVQSFFALLYPQSNDPIWRVYRWCATGCYFTNRNTKRRFYASYFPLSPTTCGRALLFCLLFYPAEAVSPVVMLLLLWGCWLKLGERQSHRVSRYEALETHLKRAHDSYAVRVSIQRPSVDNANRNKCSTDVFLFAFEQYCAWEANGIITIIIFIPARITFGLISCQAWK